MKVKELIEILEDCNPEDEVILSSDEEGNSFHPLGGVQYGSIEELNYYIERVYECELTEELEAAGVSQEDILEDGIRCLVLFP